MGTTIAVRGTGSDFFCDSDGGSDHHFFKSHSMRHQSPRLNATAFFLQWHFVFSGSRSSEDPRVSLVVDRTLPRREVNVAGAFAGASRAEEKR
jgi:hypothetical protein